MARDHGRIFSRIWNDHEFTNLPPLTQRLYLFLLSQADLNHAGVIPLRPRKWSRTTTESASELLAHLDLLAAARFVVVDEDTEEVMVRSFIRNDGVWKQPNVVRAMVREALAVSSLLIQQEIVAEVDRIDLEPLAKGQRETTETLLGTLREGFTENVQKASANPQRAFPLPLPPPHSPSTFDGPLGVEVALSDARGATA